MAADVRFARPDDGLKFLRACSVLELPRLKSKVISHNGQTQSAYWITPKLGHVRLRLYDKGLQSKTAPAGELVRVERQFRWQGKKRPDPASMAQGDLGTMWQGQLRVWEGCDDVVVAGLDDHARLIMERAEDGTINPNKALRLSGEILQRGRGFGRDWWVVQGKGRQWARHTKELRDLGIVLDEDGLPSKRSPTTLPLGTILRALREAWPTAPPAPGSGSSDRSPSCSPPGSAEPLSLGSSVGELRGAGADAHDHAATVEVRGYVAEIDRRRVQGLMA
ncbi:MAG: hypothetical protein ACRD6W_09435 [Nitrososphaerales archaeon]